MNSPLTWRVLAVLLLTGLAVQRFATARKPIGTDEYYHQIRLAADDVPSHIGPWIGQDVTVPVQALTLLKPNVMISRRYIDIENGAVAGVIFVHCSDAHDMAGHFPLRCYPADDWQVRSARPRDWMAADLRITGTEYQFFKEDRAGQHSVVVANCVLRPNGQVLRDMGAGWARSIAGTGGELTGAGQLQIYLDASLPEAQRDQAIQTLLAGYRPLIDVILRDPAAFHQTKGNP